VQRPYGKLKNFEQAGVLTSVLVSGARSGPSPLRFGGNKDRRQQRRPFSQESDAEEHRITHLTSLRVGGRHLHADTQPPGVSPAPLPRRL
jgi:hypothetical protein